MTQTIEAPHGGDEHRKDLLIGEEADYGDEAPQGGRRHGRRTYAAVAGGLVLVVGIGLLGGRFFFKDGGEAEAGLPRGDRGATAPAVDPNKTSTSGGSFGKLALECTGIDVDRSGNGYTYTPETQVTAGNASSSRLFTVIIYSEYNTGADKLNATSGIGPVSFDVGEGIPASLAVVDFSAAPNPPDSAGEVPGIGDIALLTRNNQAEIFGCPAGVSLDPAGLASAPN